VVLALVAACQGAPSLSTTHQASVVVSPLTYDFGTLEVGQTSTAKTISVNPAVGDNYDTVTAVTASCPDFAISAPGLPADVYRECEFTDGPLPAKGEASALPCTTIAYQNYTFTAQFRPTVAGTVSCVVTITTNNTTNRTITLSGTGSVPPIKIDVQPGSVAFGDVRRDTTSSPAQIMVRNLGAQTMTVSAVSASAGFAIAAGPDTGYTLGPGGAQAYAVVCTPTSVGALGGQFVVTSDDPSRPEVTIPLSCSGIDSNLDVSPSPTELPATRVGEPVEATIVLVNTGGADMTLEAVEIVSGELELLAAPGAGTMLAANGGSDVVRVRHAAAAEGPASGTLQITYDGGQIRTAQISAVALATSMALTPDGDVDLGPICIGQAKTQAFSLIANAAADFIVGDIAPPAEPFTLAAPALPVTVQGSGTATLAFEVTATPTVPGAAASTISITTDIPGASPREIRMSAIGLAEGVSPTPEALDLGSVTVDTTTIGEPITLSNCRPAATVISNARIEGPDAASFAIVAQPMSGTVAPNGTATWLVVLSPRAVGPKTASFLVDYDGGTAVVSLTGEGLDPDVTGGSGGPASYYACSTGAPSALWPLGLVVALLLVRRRRHPGLPSVPDAGR